MIWSIFSNFNVDLFLNAYLIGRHFLKARFIIGQIAACTALLYTLCTGFFKAKRDGQKEVRDLVYLLSLGLSVFSGPPGPVVKSNKLRICNLIQLIEKEKQNQTCHHIE